MRNRKVRRKQKGQKMSSPQEEPKDVGEVKGLRLGIDVLVADDFKQLKGKYASGYYESDGARLDGRYHDRSADTLARRKLVCTVQSGARHPRRVGSPRDRRLGGREDWLAVYSLYGKNGAGRRSCSLTISTRWYLTCRMSARGSTRTRRRWRCR